jgi:hypothetical protein
VAGQDSAGFVRENENVMARARQSLAHDVSELTAQKHKRLVMELRGSPRRRCLGEYPPLRAGDSTRGPPRGRPGEETAQAAPLVRLAPRICTWLETSAGGELQGVGLSQLASAFSCLRYFPDVSFLEVRAISRGTSGRRGQEPIRHSGTVDLRK